MDRRRLLIRAIYIFLLGLLLSMIYWMINPGLFFAWSKWNGDPVVPREIGAPDPLLGWALKPGAKAVSWRTGERIEYEIDAFGLRAMDQSGANPACGVAALGDSNTFGYGVAIENLWLTHLHEELPSLKIWNLGVSGYGVDQEWLRYQSRPAEVQPQLVILFVRHFGDERHLHAYRFGRSKPFFSEEANGDLVLHTSHISERVEPDRPLQLSPVELAEKSMRLGLRLIHKTEEEVLKSGAKFMLLAGFPELCERFTTSPCLNVQLTIRGHGVTGIDGEDFHHINGEGAKKLAHELAPYLREQNLLPSLCFESKSAP